MSKKKTSIILFLCVGIVLGGILFLNSEFMKIDGCLDNGGMWDYENEVCSY